MAAVSWESIRTLRLFEPRSDSFIIKIMNTRRLVTDYSKAFSFNKLKLYVHSLAKFDDIIIGYEIKPIKKFELVILAEKYLLFASKDLRPRKFKIKYEDGNLILFSFGSGNFLFILKG